VFEFEHSNGFHMNNAKIPCPITEPRPLCSTMFTLNVGRNGSEGKIPRLGNMLSVCLFFKHVNFKAEFLQDRFQP